MSLTQYAEATAPTPIQRRLLVPLAALLLLLVGGFGGALLHMQHARLARDCRQVLRQTSAHLRERLEEQSAALIALGESVEDALRHDGDLVAALGAGNGDVLLARFRSLFTRLRTRHGISRMCLYGPDGVSVLRLHDPARSGDRVARVTLREARRTGRSAAGLELAPQGVFTLRVVRPISSDGTRIGYLELGKGIGDVLETISREPEIEVAAFARKSGVERQSWESVRAVGSGSEWGRFDDHVLIYSTLSPFPGALQPFSGSANPVLGEPTDAALGDRAWRMLVSPLTNASGARIGDLIVLHDTTAAEAAFSHVLVVSSIGALLLLAALLGILHMLLRRIDRGIRTQRAALQKSKDRLDQLAEQGRTFVWEVDANGLYTYVSHVVEQVVGYRPEELVGRKHFYDLHPPAHREEFKMAAFEVFASAARFKDVENAIQTKDGRIVWVSTDGLPLLDADGRLCGYRGSDTDITQKRALTQELTHIKQAIDASSNAICIATAEGRHFYHNDTFGRVFGYELADFETQHPTVLYADPEVGRQVFATVASGGQCDREIEMISRKGRRFPVHIHANAVKDDQGDVVALIGVFTDITERKQAEDELRRMNEHLEQQTAFANSMASEAAMANAAKSEFLANMSHEIRTPMNGVIGMVGLLLDTELDENQRHYAETVLSSAEALLGLLNDILDFSKIEAGKLEMEMLDFDLRELLDDFAVMMAVKAEDKNLEFLCAITPETPSLLRGDPGRLRQVLINLAGNALKFTQEGEISVRASLESEGDDTVLVRFRVRDTGIGIPEDRQADLFHQFTQVDSSTTRKYGGTGLGLAISKQLAEAMGGTIGVDSTLDEGTEFWFTARFHKQAEQERDLAPPADLGNARVLVADDNATNRDIQITQFRAWGMRPDQAADGETCLRLLRQAQAAGDPYQIAVLDMQMPGMDGEELGRMIKADADLAATRLVMMTSLGRRGDARRFEEIGFGAYLTKPVRRTDLFDALVAVIGGATHPADRPLITRHTIREMRRGKTRILVAEDNITNQQVAVGILKRLGLTADAVANGLEAVRALESLPYDLVLMDCQMPEMDGYEAAACVRDPASRVRDHDIPIIAMTAHAMQGDREKCLAAGMNDYLPKPVSPQELSDMMDKWLPKDTHGDQAPAAARAETSAPSGAGDESTSASRVFDKAGLLARLMDDEELVQTVIQVFLQDLPEQIQALKASLEADDAARAERQAHSIKGAAANVGGEALRDIAFAMEKGGKAGDLDAVRAHMAELERGFQHLRDAFHNEL